MVKKEEEIEEIEEFKIEENKESKINNKIPEEYVIALEHAFEEYRIYGDERDIKLFEVEQHKTTTLPCMIQKISAWFDPRNMIDFHNQMILSHENVKDKIKKFKEYRKTHDKIPFDIKRGFKPEIDD